MTEITRKFKIIDLPAIAEKHLPSSIVFHKEDHFKTGANNASGFPSLYNLWNNYDVWWLKMRVSLLISHLERWWSPENWGFGGLRWSRHTVPFWKVEKVRRRKIAEQGWQKHMQYNNNSITSIMSFEWMNPTSWACFHRTVSFSRITH